MYSDAIINEITFDHLNTKCLIQISKFARALHLLNGTILKLQDENIVAKVMHHNQINNNRELNKIFNLLASELEASIVNSKFESSLLNHFTFKSKAENKRSFLN